MPGRTLDQILLDTLGLKEMTIARLIWQVEDLKATLAGKDAEIAALTADKDDRGRTGTQ